MTFMVDRQSDPAGEKQLNCELKRGAKWTHRARPAVAAAVDEPLRQMKSRRRRLRSTQTSMKEENEPHKLKATRRTYFLQVSDIGLAEGYSFGFSGYKFQVSSFKFSSEI